MILEILTAFLKMALTFACPYYYSLYEYNDSNADGTRRSNIKMSFVWAGLPSSSW